MIGNLTLVEVTCCNCYMHFAMDAEFRRHRIEDHMIFYCPVGHSQSYTGEREVDKLKRENQSLSTKLRWAETEAEDAKRQRKEARAKLTKFKNRIAAGVCPCCNRTFQNVARHMAGQHPEYVEFNHG